MGQQLIGTCKQCKTNNDELLLPQLDVPKEIKNETIKKQRELMAEFESFTLVKTTKYSLKFDGVFRKQDVISEKVIDSLGVVKPMDIGKLELINQESEIKYRFALQLGERVNFPLKSLNGNHIELSDPGYTLVKSWRQGEQMINFAACMEISGITLIGLIRGDATKYQKMIATNEWDAYKHILLQPDSVLDLNYDESTLEISKDNLLSAMLLYDGVLIYKKYCQSHEIEADGEEVVRDVLNFIENGIRDHKPIDANNQQSAITQAEYLKLKKTILNSKKQKFSRDIEITITKKTIYHKEEKQVIYEQPIIYLNSSPKSLSITDKLAASISQKNINWDSKILKNVLSEIIKNHKLNVKVALEKDIIVEVTKDICSVFVATWEQGILMPYYQNAGYMSQIKLWFKAAESIKYEFNPDPVLDKINQMIAKLFTQVPKVEKVINEPYNKICFVEKWKPPYEECENLKSDDIKRKSDKILLLWLFDYEREENMERLKELIKVKRANPQYELQVIILGYLKFETWTKLFFDFMQKYDLNSAVLDQTIETWFPQQEKFGNIPFCVILYKLYGLLLDKKDMMIVDTQGFVRFVDNSNSIIYNLETYIKKLDIKIKLNTSNYNYWRQYQSFKKCIREHPELKEIAEKVKKIFSDETSAIIIEQKKDKIWIFENGIVKEDKEHQQPTRVLRNITDYSEINEIARIIARYIDNRDILPLK